MGGDEFDYSDEYEDDGKPGTVRTRDTTSPARCHLARLSPLASVAPFHVTLPGFLQKLGVCELCPFKLARTESCAVSRVSQVVENQPHDEEVTLASEPSGESVRHSPSLRLNSRPLVAPSHPVLSGACAHFSVGVSKTSRRQDRAAGADQPCYAEIGAVSLTQPSRHPSVLTPRASRVARLPPPTHPSRRNGTPECPNVSTLKAPNCAPFTHVLKTALALSDLRLPCLRSPRAAGRRRIWGPWHNEPRDDEPRGGLAAAARGGRGGGERGGGGE